MYNFQDLSLAKPIIEKRFTKNPSASLSGMFKFLRRHSKFSAFGDYPIISIILSTLKEMNIRITKIQFLYGCRLSQEIKGQKTLLRCLWETYSL